MTGVDSRAASTTAQAMPGCRLVHLVGPSEQPDAVDLSDGALQRPGRDASGAGPYLVPREAIEVINAEYHRQTASQWIQVQQIRGQARPDGGKGQRRGED